METSYFKIKTQTLLFICAFFLVRCQQEELQQSVPAIGQIAHSLGEKDNMLVDLAKALASSMENEEVKSFLKEKAVKKFDGDYDIFFHSVKDAPISIGNTQGRVKTLRFAEVLFKESISATARNSEGGNLQEYLDKLQKAYPLLQIAIPALPGIKADTWDIDKHTPLVVPLTTDFNERTTKFVKAYDVQGNVHMIDATVPPHELIIVISQNERLMAIDKEEFNKKFSSVSGRCPIRIYYQYLNTIYVLKKDYYSSACILSGSVLRGNSGGISVGAACDRDRKRGKDILYSAKFKNMKALRSAESYLNGNPEIYCVITLGNKDESGFSTLRKSIASPDRSKWKDCGIFSCSPEWFYINAEVVTWDKSIYGDRMKYLWVEDDDDNDSYQYTIGLSTTFDSEGSSKKTVTGQAKITLKGEDVNLGESVVEYCDNTDNTGSQYDTAFLYFKIKQ